MAAMIQNQVYTDFTLTLPLEQAMGIFGRLDPTALAQCCRVNRKWRELANDELSCVPRWKSIASRRFVVVGPSSQKLVAVLNGKKQHFTFCIAKTSKDIIDHAQAWANQIRIGDHAVFRVRCLSDDRCSMDASFYLEPRFFPTDDAKLDVSVAPTCPAESDAQCAPLAIETHCLFIPNLPSSTTVRSICLTYDLVKGYHDYYVTLPEGTLLCPPPADPSACLAWLEQLNEALVDGDYTHLAADAMRSDPFEGFIMQIPIILRTLADSLQRSSSI